MSTQDVLILLYDVFVDVIIYINFHASPVFSADLFSFMIMTYIHSVYQLINLILMSADF